MYVETKCKNVVQKFVLVIAKFTTNKVEKSNPTIYMYMPISLHKCDHVGIAQILVQISNEGF